MYSSKYMSLECHCYPGKTHLVLCKREFAFLWKCLFNDESRARRGGKASRTSSVSAVLGRLILVLTFSLLSLERLSLEAGSVKGKFFDSGISAHACR